MRFKNDPQLITTWGADAFVEKIEGAAALIAKIHAVLDNRTKGAA